MSDEQQKWILSSCASYEFNGEPVNVLNDGSFEILSTGEIWNAVT